MDQKQYAKPMLPVNFITSSSGKDRRPELVEENQNLIRQNVSAVQTPLTSETQPGEQEENQSENQVISNVRPNSPINSGESDYYSCNDSENSSEEDDLLMKEHNEIFIVQAPPASEVQPGGEQDAIQTEEDTIDNLGSAFPTSSEDSHDDSAGPCGEQDLLSRRMEHLKQRSQDCLEEDSLTAGQNETSALQIPLTSEIQPGEQDANQSEEHTVHNPRSTSPSGSEDSSDDYEELCEEQDLLTCRMEHLRQRDQEGEEESMAFGSGGKENMKVPVWESIWSSISSVLSLFGKRVKSIWSHFCSFWSSFSRLVQRSGKHGSCSAG